MNRRNHSFVMESKLHDVKGRVDYISSPKRQENLYAVFSNVEDSYWELLAEQNQRDFAKSGTEGTCIEARELIIMLPPSLIDYDHEILLKYMTSKFLEKYDVGCCAALHHNKSKTNLHIHLIFSEREIRQEAERKIASRNMFYNESGKHVRTKKEILDENGNVRPGCKIIKKGEVYETNFFQPKKEEFKTNAFLENMKQVMTDALNGIVKDENEKLQVFQKGGPYLATKKIGKNNPKEAEIKADNYLRQEWNHMVDRAVTEGVTEDELRHVKKKEITVPAQESIIKAGWKPDQFRNILQKAIGKLRGFIQFMKEIRNGEFDARGNPLIRHDLKFDVTPAPLPESARGERPSSALQEAEVMRLDRILQKMKKAEQKIYAIEKAKLRLEKELKEVQKKWFHGKEKKELEQKIAGKRQELKKAQETLSEIPKMQGYENALEVKKAYKVAVTELEGVRKLQSEWDQKGIPEKKYWVIKANVPEQTRQKSIHERLEEKKRGMEQQKKKERKRNQDRDCL